MIPGIRRIVALLSDDNYTVRTLAAESFAQLIDRREFLCVSIPTELLLCILALFHEAIKTEFPAIIELFSANNYVVQSKAAKWLGQLGNRREFAFVSAHRLCFNHVS
jgi:HEAT repeat protein